MIFPCPIFSFVKDALTKNPKRRPTAEKMLYHKFLLAGDLNMRLSLELLNKVRNPEAASSSSLSALSTSSSTTSGVSNSSSAGLAGGVGAVGSSTNTSAASAQSSAYAGVASASTIADDDEGGVTQNVPMRIPSRSSRKEKTNSEINSKKVSLFVPIHDVRIIRNGGKCLLGF